MRVLASVRRIPSRARIALQAACLMRRLAPRPTELEAAEQAGQSDSALTRYVRTGVHIAFDPAEGKLVFSSFVGGRPRQDLALEVGPDSVVRGFTLPTGGMVRYTITVQDKVWQEVGEYSTDGNIWHTFLEMRLTRR